MPPFQKKAVTEAPTETTPEIAPNTALTITFDQLKELLGGHAQGISSDVLSEIMAKTAQLSADAMRKSLKPENPFAPEISVFSYPEGERAKPRPELPFELLWMGFPIHKESSVYTWWELEQLAQLKPGVYSCSLRDGGGTLKVTVGADTTPDGTIRRLTVTVDKLDRDVRPLIPSPYVWAYQMNHADIPARDSYVEAMTSMLLIAKRDRDDKARQLGLAS